MPPEDHTLPPDQLDDAEPTRIKPRAPAPAAGDDLMDVEATSVEPTALVGAAGRLRAQQNARMLSDPSITVQELQEKPKSRGGGGVVLLLGALVGGAALGGVWLKFFAHPAPDAAAVVAVSEEARPVLIVNASQPQAQVFVGARNLGSTPLEVDNDFAFGTPVTLIVRAPGFADVTAQVVGGRGQRVQVTFGKPLP